MKWDQGVIVKVMHKRGFGYVIPDNHKTLYFHASDLEGCTLEDLSEGARVEFVVVHSAKKAQRAKRVRLVG